jgi:Type I phosphodiesterase / nucleotide pyrophosphatase
VTQPSSAPSSSAPPVPDDRLPAGAFAVTRPEYGTGSLADLLPSVSALLGVPGADDVLGLRESLDGIRRIAVLLVDGLGAHQLPLLRPYAPILDDLAGRTLTSGFPSTTPVSLVTLGTGVPPGAHGVLGFTVRRPDGRVLNHIFWSDDPDPMEWQPVPTRFARAAAAGVAVTTITRPEFEGSGLTVSANRGGTFVGAADADALAASMLRALGGGDGPALVYGYHPDLDQAGHLAGVDSEAWRDAARGVDRLLDRLLTGLPPDTALLVTADHGQVNIPYAQRFDLGVDPVLKDGLVGVAGEPRVRYLYTAPGARDDVMAAYRSVLGSSAWVLTRDEAIDGGWFGPVSAEHRDRIGEIVVICLDRAVVLASGWEPPAVASLIGFHGSVTAAEMTIPLLIGRR